MRTLRHALFFLMKGIEELAKVAEALAGSLSKLQEQYKAMGKIKITLDQRFCPICNGASIVGRVDTKDAYDLKAVDDLSFVRPIKRAQPGRRYPY